MEKDLSNLSSQETAIVMGNGESLNSMPKKILNKYESFGVNYINLCGINPTYYICIDTDVLRDHSDMIIDVASKAKRAFLSENYAKSDLHDTKKLYTLGNISLVGGDTNVFKGEKAMSGHTGVYVALKMAYYIGFKTILLFGVDHDAEWKHCIEDYPIGVKTSEGKKSNMRWHFNYANQIYKSSGRSIYNFSLPSKLDDENIFERVSLDNWL